ncbi:MAG: hypothetical protein WCH96_06455 [Betaproteobacteria bacterium]
MPLKSSSKRSGLTKAQQSQPKKTFSPIAPKSAQHSTNPLAQTQSRKVLGQHYRAKYGVK